MWFRLALHQLGAMMAVPVLQHVVKELGRNKKHNMVLQFRHQLAQHHVWRQKVYDGRAHVQH